MSTPAYLPGMEAEHRSRELSQFYTPPDLAARVWAWCSVYVTPRRSFRVLEPSAGNGALVRPMLAGAKRPDEIVMYEIDPLRASVLLDLCLIGDAAGVDASFRPLDFTRDHDPGRFDLCVMNPPFEQDQDAMFIEQALGCSTAVVGIFRSAFVHGQGRWNRLWRFTDVRRLAWLSARPDFGGEWGAKADFVVMHLTRRTVARKQGEAFTLNAEWW